MSNAHAGARVFDSRDPWTLDIRLLQSRSQAWRGEVEFESPRRIGGEFIAIEQGAPVVLSVELWETEEGVSVSGDVRAPVNAECSRCLEPFHSATTANFREFFAFSPPQEESEEEALVVVGGKVDVEQSVIDAVVLGFPLSPLCDPECLGLCAQCGVLLSTVPASHTHETVDPRWAGLMEKFSAPDAQPATADSSQHSQEKEVGEP